MAHTVYQTDLPKNDPFSTLLQHLRIKDERPLAPAAYYEV